MASHADHASGHMNITEQKATFHNVMGMFKWGSLYTAATITLLTLWFCTPAGVVPAIVVAAIELALGLLLLRDKKAAAH